MVLIKPDSFETVVEYDAYTILTHSAFRSPSLVPVIDPYTYRTIHLDSVRYTTGESAMPNPIHPFEHPFCPDNDAALLEYADLQTLPPYFYWVTTANIYQPDPSYPNDPNLCMHSVDPVPVVYFAKHCTGIVIVPGPINNGSGKLTLALVSYPVAARTIFGEEKLAHRHRYLFSKRKRDVGVECTFWEREMQFDKNVNTYKLIGFIQSLICKSKGL